jgi:hypothetical protein
VRARRGWSDHAGIDEYTGYGLAMLIDEFLPAYDVVERHRTCVRASPAAVYEALTHADLAGSPIIRLLLGLRMLPLLIVAPASFVRAASSRAGRAITLRDFEARGFKVLADDPPREILIGVVGTFWTAAGERRHVDATTFKGPQPAGTARAAWNFRIVPDGADRCVVTTETRVQCADARSRRRFRWYWLIVRPGSGLIRRLMLRAIRRHAEARPARRTALPGSAD